MKRLNGMKRLKEINWRDVDALKTFSRRSEDNSVPTQSFFLEQFEEYRLDLHETLRISLDVNSTKSGNPQNILSCTDNSES